MDSDDEEVSKPLGLLKRKCNGDSESDCSRPMKRRLRNDGHGGDFYGRYAAVRYVVEEEYDLQNDRYERWEVMELYYESTRSVSGRWVSVSGKLL